jgi:hypothetical protein
MTVFWANRSSSPSCSARRGLIHLEVLASLSLTVVLATLLTVATLQYSAVRCECDLRRQLQLAAAAELDRCRAGLPPTTAPAPAGALNPLQLETTQTAGVGDWAGLTRVTVVARQRVSAQRVLSVTLIGYVPEGVSP